MSIKKLNKLTMMTKEGKDILINLIKNNDELKNEVEDYLIETEMFYIREILDELKGISNYSIGFYNNNFIEIYRDLRNEINFIDSCIEISNNYGVFNIDEDEWIKELYGKANNLYYMDYENQNYNNLENEVELEIDELRDLLVSKFNDMTNIDNYDIEGYLIDIYVDKLIDNNIVYYYDDNSYELKTKDEYINNIKVFYSNGNIENEISEYIGVSKQYLKEKLNNYIESNGSQIIYDIDNPLNIFNNATCIGFLIDEYEILPVTLMTKENKDILLNMIIVAG